MEIFNGDCLEKMKDLKDDSIDLIFCDLPYGQTSCKWDCKIDLELFWKEIMRIKKLHTPIFFTTTTKFGVELITSAPKKCHFRYDIVWVKSSPAGFLSAKKMPMRKHEMIYVFYEKLPFYDLSSHTHKFLKPRPPVKKGDHIYGDNVKSERKSYEPPLPNSVIKEEIAEGQTLGDKGNECYGKFSYYNNGVKGYDPPLPVSVVKEEKTQISKCKDRDLYGDMKGGTIGNVHGTNYDPPLPVSIVKEELCKYDVNKNTYGGGKEGRIKISKDKKDHQQKYDPPLPVSIVKEQPEMMEIKLKDTLYGDVKINQPANDDGTRNNYRGKFYDPPLPNSMLEIKSTKGKHSTEKPVALMEWILKYYSKEGDVVLDPTMGSGSTGVACKNMNRKFIGIEKDKDIFDGAVERLN